MPIVFVPSIALGTMKRLVCPNCGHVQARERKPKVHWYQCFRCRRSFSAIESRQDRKTRPKPYLSEEPVD